MRNTTTAAIQLLCLLWYASNKGIDSTSNKIKDLVLQVLELPLLYNDKRNCHSCVIGVLVKQSRVLAGSAVLGGGVGAADPDHTSLSDASYLPGCPLTTGD